MSEKKNYSNTYLEVELLTPLPQLWWTTFAWPSGSSFLTHLSHYKLHATLKMLFLPIYTYSPIKGTFNDKTAYCSFHMFVKGFLVITFFYYLLFIYVYRHDVTKVGDFYNGGLWGNVSFFVGSNWNFVSGYIKKVDTHHESFSYI